MKKLILAAFILEAGLKLFFKTFFTLIPLVIIYGAIRLLIHQLALFSTSSTWSGYLLSLAIPIFQLVTYIFFFCVAIAYVYSKHYNQTISLRLAIKHAIGRYWQMLLAYLIGILLTFIVVIGASLLLVLPSVIPIIIAVKLHQLNELWNSLLITVSNFLSQLINGFTLGFLQMFTFYPLFLINLVEHLRAGNLNIIEIIVITVCLCIVLCFFVTSVFVVNKNGNALKGLKASWTLITNDWLTTFALLIYWTAIMVILNWLLAEFTPVLSKELVSLATFSLGPCLMVTLYDYLEKLNKSEIKVTP